MPTGPRPPIPPGFAKVVLIGTNYTHAVRNIFYLEVAGSGITSADLSTLATSIATSWNTNVAPAISSSYTLTAVQIVYVPSVGSESQGFWSGSHPGQNVSNQVEDAGASYVLSWKISAYYRGGHPRWYVAGVLNTTTSNGSDVSPTTAGSLATAFATFRGAINGMTAGTITSVTMGTLSFQSGNAWRTPPIFRTFGQVFCDTKLGSQRRRIRS